MPMISSASEGIVPAAEQPAPEPAPATEEPEPQAAAEPKPPTGSVPVAESHDEAAPAPVAFNLNTCTVEDLVQNIPDCPQDLAEAIVKYRAKIGSFQRLDQLLDVPGMTREAYTNLTGEAPPVNRVGLSLNELLGFALHQQVALKDVTERIACWPDVTGCVLSQNSGLSLVGDVPTGLDKAALVAFAPRMFDALNKSFSEVAGKETDALVIPTTETSFHLFRNKDLYLIIMSRLPQMPERHVKVARLVLAELSSRGE
jgi:competence ComEA-like helix-hairpin-helix protein